MFVSATQPSVSALMLLPKKIVNSRKIQVCFFGVGVLHVRRPNDAQTLKKGQVDVFSLVFVSADNINVSACLTTNLFI